MVDFKHIHKLWHQPRRVERYLNAMIQTGSEEQRVLANNLLALNYLEQGRITDAVARLKTTLAVAPDTFPAVWAMKVLSDLYRQLSLKAERFEVDMLRIQTLRKMLYASKSPEEMDRVVTELRQECDDRGLVLSPLGFEHSEVHGRRPDVEVPYFDGD